MAYSYHRIPYSDTGYFSNLVTNYLAGHPDAKPFYTFPANEAGLTDAILNRKNFKVDRQLLVSVLEKQYERVNAPEKVKANIRALANEGTYTITTAHQPNLMTGYMYFVYKILHAIKLAEQLNEQYPNKHFVPVYYMGSEDNDLDELGVFRFRGDKYTWDGNGQKGAVGRMSTSSLKPLLRQVFKVFGPPGKNCDELTEIITTAYLKHHTIASATQYLVNELLGKYGLVILNPDDAQLKSTFIPVMEDDLLNHTAHPIVTEQTTLLGQHYKTQAFPRPINLFYMEDGLRERIERNGDTWTVLNTEKTFTHTTLIEELHTHPEKFSPNVILRGLFQCTILPDVAFIGGSAEVAYWLQLKTLFSHYNIFFPTILLRQSVQWVNEAQTKLRQQCSLSITDVFKPLQQLENEYVIAHTSDEWRTNAEANALEAIFSTLQAKATSIDTTLSASAASALKKMKQQLTVLEKKMLRAEKKKMEVQLQRLKRLKTSLFSNGLQERTENFAEYYLQYGTNFFDILKDGINPLANMFLVIEE